MPEPIPFRPPRAAAFRTRDAADLGFTSASLRTPRLTRPAHGARLPVGSGDAEADLLAALRVLARQDQFFSHSTAARIHGLPLPRSLQRGDIHVASPSYTSRMQRPGVVGHRIRARVVEVGGLRVESPEDCFVHVATQLEHADLVAVGDAIVARGSLRLEPEDLRRNALHFAGARGMAKVHRALACVRVGAESPQETLTRLLIVGHGLPEPRLQVVVRDAGGTFVGRLDMAWPELRLGVEYDGQQHREDSRQYALDLERHRRLQEAGWLVIRVTKHELERGGARILDIIADAHRRRRGMAP